CRIDEHAAAESIYAVMDRFAPIPIPRNLAGYVPAQLKLHQGMKINQVLWSNERINLRREVSAAREVRIERAKGIPCLISIAAVRIDTQHGAGSESNLIERVSGLRGNTPCGNRIAAKRSPLIVGLPVVIEALRGGPEGPRSYSMAKLCCGPAIVRRLFGRQSQVVEIGRASRQYRGGNCEIAAPGCFLGIGSIVEEIVVILHWFQREHI